MFYIIASLLFSSINLGILGTLVLWQRIINIGDTLSHAIIFSLVIEYFFNLPPTFGAILVAIIFILGAKFIIKAKQSEQNISMIAFSSTAIALTILTSDLSDGGFRLKDFMVGDILSSGSIELAASIIILVILLVFLKFKFREIILVSVSEELASINGIKTQQIKLFIDIILAISISISIQIIGVLLMTSFLIIPASIARIYSSSPKQMMCISILVSLAASLFGLIISLYYDVGFAASAVLSLSTLYIATNIFKR